MDIVISIISGFLIGIYYRKLPIICRFIYEIKRKIMSVNNKKGNKRIIESVEDEGLGHNLTFQVDDSIVYIYMDSAGWEIFKGEFDNLLKGKKYDHTHLFSKEWGGSELTHDYSNNKVVNINHVKLYYLGKDITET